ncbi:MAG: cytochrome P450 [Hyphomicrobiales bacterium]|nr:cytochrome P450 [Hyphomicrobiales bacterium]
MFTLKYYEGVRQAQAKPAPHGSDAFVFDDLGADNLARRLKARFVRVSLIAVFAALRRFKPVLRVGRLVIVSRNCDAKSVLMRPAEFEAPYKLEMPELANGSSSKKPRANFMLGLDGEQHKLRRQWASAILKEKDVAIVGQMTEQFSRYLINGSGGRIDIMRDLFTRAAAETCIRYFGLVAPQPDQFAEWAMAISSLLFADPFGDAKTRRLALIGAARMRWLIDESLAHMRAAPRPNTDTLLGRLLRDQKKFGMSDEDIRAMLIGLIVGFVPTNTMAGGKIIDELLRRPAMFRAAVERARADDIEGLKKYMFEALRLNPPISPGVFRYAAQDSEIGGYRIAKDSVVLVSFLSALRDKDVFHRPNVFDPERANAPAAMIFGVGDHNCLGAALASEQISRTLMALLRQNGLAVASGEGSALQWTGPFPTRLDMSFEPAIAPARRSMITICAPLPDSADGKAAYEKIVSLGNPAKQPMRAALDRLGIIHYASLSVVDVGASDAPVNALLMEIVGDGPEDKIIPAFAAATQDHIGDIFRYLAPDTPLSEALARHSLSLQTRPWGVTGLNFQGTGEFSVYEIEQQAALAEAARVALDEFQKRDGRLGGRAMLALDYVRGKIRESERHARSNVDTTLRDTFEEFLIRPSRRRPLLSQWQEQTWSEFFWRLAKSRELRPALLVFVGAIVGCAVLLYRTSVNDASWIQMLAAGLSALVIAIGAVILATLVLVAIFATLLLWREIHDVSDDADPPIADVRKVIAGENPVGVVQNHLTSITPLKPGYVRRLSLALSLWGIRALVMFRYRPGFVLNMGTIHYARWFRLPGYEKLIFLSNFDGSWENYLEDFIMRAHAGQSAAWSHGVGFPRTRWLIKGGAADGDRFKRWVRRQQRPTQFWYSRFPQLTTDQIRRNALIHDGLMHARTDSAARDWLDCFGSAPRPEHMIETTEVQSLVFNGMPSRDYVRYAFVGLSDRASLGVWAGAVSRPDSGMREQNALRDLAPLTFGDSSLATRAPSAQGQGDAAVFAAFSAAGLRKCGFGESDEASRAPAGAQAPGDAALGGLGAFSPAFQIGMAQRGAIMGDVNQQQWFWSDASAADNATAKQADLVLIVYGDSVDQCTRVLSAHCALLQPQSLHVVQALPARRRRPADGDGFYENFGYRDGISQPVIRGTQKHMRAASEADVVAPGEFLLGYRNNQGYFPPSPSVSAHLDPACDLPTPACDGASPFPRFSEEGGRAIRDFGRNGAYIAIRQLEQDVAGFDNFLTLKKTQLLQEYPHIGELVGEVDEEWLAAKMMGRWRDGTSLLRSARAPAAPDLDNDFSYGLEDPQGLRCPYGAHVRRANPRDSLHPGDPAEQKITNRHRILRRGRSYVDGKAQGMMFVALCADVERQFEMIQQSWIGSPCFHGLSSEPDPVAMTGDKAQTQRTFTIPTPAGAIVLRNMQSFVTMRGGGYFFLPSRSAFHFLAARCAQRATQSRLI